MFTDPALDGGNAVMGIENRQRVTIEVEIVKSTNDIEGYAFLIFSNLMLL